MTDTLSTRTDGEHSSFKLSSDPASIFFDGDARATPTKEIEVMQFTVNPQVEPEIQITTPQFEATANPSMDAIIEKIAQLRGPIPEEIIADLKEHDTQRKQDVSNIETTNELARQHIENLQATTDSEAEVDNINAQDSFIERKAQLERQRDAKIAEITRETENAIQVESLRLITSVGHNRDKLHAANSLVDSTEAAASENRRIINGLKSLRDQHIERRDTQVAEINRLYARQQALPDELVAANGELQKLADGIETAEAKILEWAEKLSDLEDAEYKERCEDKAEELASIDKYYTEDGILPIEAKEQAKKNILKKASSAELTRIIDQIAVYEARIKEKSRFKADNETLHGDQTLVIQQLKIEKESIQAQIDLAHEALNLELSTPFWELEKLSDYLLKSSPAFYGVAKGDLAKFSDIVMPRFMAHMWIDMVTFQTVSSADPQAEIAQFTKPNFDDVDLGILLNYLEGDEPLIAMQQGMRRSADGGELADHVRQVTGMDMLQQFQDKGVEFFDSMRVAARSLKRGRFVLPIAKPGDQAHVLDEINKE